MNTNKSGICLPQGDYRAFIPAKLPPAKIIIEGVLRGAVEEASSLLDQLDTLGRSLPTPFTAVFLKKEALYSCQIEDIALSATLFDEVPEVRNYHNALENGLSQLDQLSLSLRLITNTHQILMEGAHTTPGEFRRSQNWIGPAGCTLFTAPFVPPPPHMVMELMWRLESYLHSDSSLPPLIDCALMHYQFETIHPFLDGNGRLGRLLITFYLQWKELLPSPLLYLSYYFKLHQQEYYDRLALVRTTGNYEQWILFFLQGVSDTCRSALDTLRGILSLQEEMRIFLLKNNASVSAMKLMHHLYYVPVISVREVQEVCEVSFQGASNIVKEFEQWGILHEVTGKKRSKRYAFKRYITMLSEGTEPL